MSLDTFSCLLAISDVVAIAILSASMRNEAPKALDVSFAVARCLTIFLTVFCFSGSSRWRWFSAVFVILCTGPAFVGFNDQDDSHAKLDFLVSLVFGLVEGFLLALTYSLSVGPVVVADNNRELLRESLLEEGRRAEEKSASEEVFVDSYKGQGASFRRLVSLAYPERYILALATLALLISSAASVVTPALFGRLIETISVTKDEHELNKTTLLLILMFVVTSIFSLVRGALYTLAGERLVARFRVRLFDAIIHQDIEFFDRNQSGELQSRLSSDTASIQNAVTVNVSMALRWVLQVLVSLAIILIISWKLTLVMLAVVPAVGFGARIYGTFVRDISKRYQDALAKASETAEEAMGNIRTVRSFSKEGFEVGRYKARVQVSFEEGKRRAWAYGVFIGVIGLLGYLAVALVLWRGGMMVIRGTDGLSSADLTSFLLYTLNLAVSLGGLSELYSTLISAMGASDRMFKILDTDPTINSKEDDQTLALLQKRSITYGSSLEFRKVEFHYPTRQDVKVLKGISFKCAAGTVNAFCGASGQGKSTIISLTQRYYDPSGGDILVNDVNIKDMHPVLLRSKMAVVSQEPTLFACSIAENIAYGLNRTCTQEEIIDAAKKANAYDFIMSFKPGGFDTLVGERGVQLSGGQKQRVAIARAILANPEILLLDEATSALDSESEYLVQMALEQLMQNRTTIIVAHRLSTVRHANCIFVVDNGTIAEQGTYDELIHAGGIFSSLVARQLNRNAAT